MIVPFIKHNIPLTVIFRLLGVNDVRKMLYYVTGVSPCSPTLIYKMQSILCNDTSNTTGFNSNELYDYVGLVGCSEKQKQKRIQFIKNIFLNEFLPHCGEDNQITGNVRKAFYLGYAVRKLMMVYLKEIPPDDIDSYVNKRACPTGPQFALLTRQLVRNFLKMLRAQVYRAVSNGKHVNIVDFFNHRKISAGLKYACATGNWGITRGATGQTGVCQVLNTTNLAAKFSHLRQVNMNFYY